MHPERHYGQCQPHGRVDHAVHVVHGAEQSDLSLLVLVGFHALEELYTTTVSGHAQRPDELVTSRP